MIYDCAVAVSGDRDVTHKPPVTQLPPSPYNSVSEPFYLFAANKKQSPVATHGDNKSSRCAVELRNQGRAMRTAWIWTDQIIIIDIKECDVFIWSFWKKTKAYLGKNSMWVVCHTLLLICIYWVKIRAQYDSFLNFIERRILMRDQRFFISTLEEQFVIFVSISFIFCTTLL